VIINDTYNVYVYYYSIFFPVNIEMSYTLDHLFIFSDAEINQILTYFNNPISPDPLINRYNAIALSANNSILDPNDVKYVLSPYFYEAIITRKLNPQQIRQFINSPQIPINIPAPTTPKITVPTPKITVPTPKITVPTPKITVPTPKIMVPTPTAGPVSPRINAQTTVYQGNVPNIPDKIPGGIGVYQWEGNVLVCGPKTYNLRGELKNMGGIYDGTYKCWMFSVDKANELADFVERKKLEAVAHAERKKLEAAAHAEKRKIENIAKYEAERALKNLPKEEEATFVPNIRRLPRNTVETAERDGTAYDLAWNMYQRDADELLPWRDVIKIIDKENGLLKSKATVTYTGDVKPPDEALALAVDTWNTRALGFGHTVKRIGYKLYYVTVNID
jgi:hypothetical protein